MSDTELHDKIDALCGEILDYGESNDGAIDGQIIKEIMNLIHARDRALLARIRAELPESIYSKLDKCPYCGTPYQYSCTCDTGFDAAIADVTAILTKMEEQL